MVGTQQICAVRFVRCLGCATAVKALASYAMLLSSPQMSLRSSSLEGNGRLDQYQTMMTMTRKVTPAPASTCRRWRDRHTIRGAQEAYCHALYTSCGPSPYTEAREVKGGVTYDLGMLLVFEVDIFPFPLL